MTQPGGGRWNDLRTRVISAIAMLAVGSVAIWQGGLIFAALAVVLTGLMVWEFSRMIRPDHGRDAVWLAVLAAIAMFAALQDRGPFALVFLATVPVAVLFPALPDRVIYAAYAGLIMLAGYGLIALRDSAGISAILWLVGVVIASDILGYFAGRMLGGPKFWPRISPKKTWSGTVAGWAGAALVGLGFVQAGYAGWALIVISPLVALAGQMGDIAESWIKRRAGMKDSSALIPGHGGVLDRFDALIGAAALVTLLSLGLMLPLPLVTGN